MSIIDALLAMFSRNKIIPNSAPYLFRTKKPAGNRALSPERQREVMVAAHQKRERKLARPQGWYAG